MPFSVFSSKLKQVINLVRDPRARFASADKLDGMRFDLKTGTLDHQCNSVVEMDDFGRSRMSTSRFYIDT